MAENKSSVLSIITLVVACIAVVLVLMIAMKPVQAPIDVNALQSGIVTAVLAQIPQPEKVDLSGINTQLADLSTKVTDLSTPATAEVPTDSLTDKVNTICKLTDGCEVYTIETYPTVTKANKVLSYLTDNSEKRLRTELETLVKLDRDDFNIRDFDLQDSIVTAASKQDKNDGIYDVELFLRIKYKDYDVADSEVIYVSIKATLEDTDEVDITSVTEVDRTYEI